MRTVRCITTFASIVLTMAACTDASRIADPESGLVPSAPSEARIKVKLPSTTSVSMIDNCDQDSFNHALGKGTCVHKQGLRFPQFLSDLATNHTVPSWANVPAAFESAIGRTLDVTNNGGEVHTFTEVAKFGGGIVPFLNTLARTNEVAPECKALDPTDFVAPGAVYHETLTHIGPTNFQCCIHPWMHATVQVGKGIGGP